MLKLGIVKYVNALPFALALQEMSKHMSVSLVKAVPSDLNGMLYHGHLDLALISSAEYLMHRDQYVLLQGLCLGATSEVLSVKLYTKKSIPELDLERIAVTSDSASSALLLRVLCTCFWHVAPHIEIVKTQELSTEHAAHLLIGDVCLKQELPEGYHCIDLAQAWYHATGLPFTFAVFAARRKAIEEQGDTIMEIQHFLQEELTRIEANPSNLMQVAMKQCPVSEKKLEQYYSLLNYAMTPSHLESLQIFDELSSILQETHE
jgi:chorismate dehydratase